MIPHSQPSEPPGNIARATLRAREGLVRELPSRVYAPERGVHRAIFRSLSLEKFDQKIGPPRPLVGSSRSGPPSRKRPAVSPIRVVDSTAQKISQNSMTQAPGRAARISTHPSPNPKNSDAHSIYDDLRISPHMTERRMNAFVSRPNESRADNPPGFMSRF
jgi:hypothetical protein